MEFSPWVDNAEKRNLIDTTHLKIGMAVIDQDTDVAWEWGGTYWEPLCHHPENGHIQQRWTGVFSVAVISDWLYQKNGKQVTLWVGDLIATPDIQNEYINAVVKLPDNLIPQTDVSFPLDVYDNSVSSRGLISISNTGKTKILKSLKGLPFSGLGLTGFSKTIITYNIA